MSKDELQAIGNWTELPEGGHGDPSRKKSKANIPMGFHYAGGKLERSATTKRKCVARFLQMMQKKLTSSSLSEDGLLPRDSWGWGEFASLHQEMEELEIEQPKQTMEAPEMLANPDQIEVSEEVELPVVEESPASPISSSSSTSSSASDISAEGVDLVGILPDSTAVDDLMWLRQGRKIHLIKEEPDGGHPIPWLPRQKPSLKNHSSGAEVSHNLPIRHFARGVSLECPEGCTPRWLTTMAGCIDSQPVYERKKGCQPLLVCVALSQPPVGLMSLFFHDSLHAVEVFYFKCFV